MVTCFFSHLCPSYFTQYELTTYIVRRCVCQDVCESDVRHGIEEMLRQRYWVGNRPYIRWQTSGDSLEKEGGYATSVAYPPSLLYVRERLVDVGVDAYPAMRIGIIPVLDGS